MERHYYMVAGHRFMVMLRRGTLGSNYTPFVTKSGAALFVLEETDAMPPMQLEPFPLPIDSDCDAAHIVLHTAHWDGSSGLLFELSPRCGTPPVVRLLVDRNKSHSWMSIDNEWQRRFAIDSCLMLLYALFTAHRSTLLIHASTVVRDRFGYLFLGVSGTGKSTHSRLWCETWNDVWLLNDDNPVIRISEVGDAQVYGTPWSGKTPCYLNSSAPIGAIVDLEQAPYNEIVPMSIPQAYAALLSSSSGLKADSLTADNLHNTLATVLRQVKCWHLRCLPNSEAARLCHDTVIATLPSYSLET